MGTSVSSVLKRCLAILMFIAILVSAALAFWNRQVIGDHFRASNFEASAEVLELAERLDLTQSGTRIFFASHPTIDSSQHFNAQCAQVDHADSGHVLGCFSDQKIHLFGVTDERLGDVVEVTAAHELLHATYARLRPGERESLAQHLLQFYEERSEADTDLKERMEVYDHLSKAAFANELHSVLATEVRDLPDWLEKHYTRWLNDRAGIIDSFESYHAVFSEILNRAQVLQQDLIELRASYEERSRAYEREVERFNADSHALQMRNEAYEFSSNADEFYRLRDELDARRMNLESELESLEADAAHYEQLRQELSELSETSSELDRQLDSDLAPLTNNTPE